MEASQKTVVITGATRGIGKNTALYFAERGYAVVGTGRNEQLLQELEAQLRSLSPQSRCYPLDVQRLESVREATWRMAESFQTIDVWINNAGAFEAIGPMWEVDPDVWKNDVSTNLMGTFHCVHAVAPLLLRQGTGRIINVVGGGTVGEFRYGSGYGTSKTAIARLTENLDAELAATGTRVAAFALDPGLNDTDMTKFQRETEAGRKYFERIGQAFLEHRDVPPDWAPTLAYQLAEGLLDAYRGRVLSVYDDVAKLQERGGELQDGGGADLFKLRLSKLDNIRR